MACNSSFHLLPLIGLCGSEHSFVVFFLSCPGHKFPCEWDTLPATPTLVLPKWLVIAMERGEKWGMWGPSKFPPAILNFRSPQWGELAWGRHCSFTLNSGYRDSRSGSETQLLTGAKSNLTGQVSLTHSAEPQTTWRFLNEKRMFAVVNHWDFEIVVASLLKEIWLTQRYYARGLCYFNLTEILY